MEAIRVMPSEIQALQDHFDRIIHDTIIPRMDRLEAKVDAVDAQARLTNGRVKSVELWQARWEGVRDGAGASWHVIVAVGGLAVGAVGLVAAFGGG